MSVQGLRSAAYSVQHMQGDNFIGRHFLKPFELWYTSVVYCRRWCLHSLGSDSVEFVCKELDEIGGRMFSFFVHQLWLTPVVIMYQVAATGYANPDSYQLLLSSSWSGLAETDHCNVDW